MDQSSTSQELIAQDENLRNEIEELEAKLAAAKAKLRSNTAIEQAIPAGHATIEPPANDISPQTLHLWLLLADSALPIGSFAFSSGLESYIAHRPLRPAPTTPTPNSTSKPKPSPREELSRFLRLSLLSVSTTTVPFITTAFLNPSTAPELDDIFDASTTCEVARRASVSQGRALRSVWDKSFSSSLLPNPPSGSGSEINPTHRPDHFGVAWGYITRLSGLPATDASLHQVLFVFLFNHVKAVLSAAVRQSLIGPYVSQQMLASGDTRRMVMEAVEKGRRIKVEDAGQCVPALDLWQGRHEKLYTRIFNS
ncbi:hypothetical protein ABW19_dt0205996 [Dactylella cylindrospora]|nr:hypothetical protein ABW19_dt0205996 [Dactylella cylindrospora]